jgi:uncharacterized damage-inducible protein DinB
MNQSLNLSLRFREVFLNGRWIANTNYSDILSDLDFNETNQKIGSLNSIGLLTQHINYYLEGMLPVFDGGELLIRDKHSFDFKPLEDEVEWSALREKLNTNAKAFAEKVEELNDDHLHSVFVKDDYGSFARNIEAMIEHGYYHLGQISLIKKMILSANQ